MTLDAFSVYFALCFKMEDCYTEKKRFSRILYATICSNINILLLCDKILIHR